MINKFWGENNFNRDLGGWINNFPRHIDFGEKVVVGGKKDKRPKFKVWKIFGEKDVGREGKFIHAWNNIAFCNS